MKRPFLLIIVLTMATAVLLSACGSPAAAEPLVILIDSDEGPLTPISYRTSTGFWMTGWVYDALYTRDLDYKPVPSLATAATPSADGLSWTIVLRQDVKWHDGEPFTSADVIFTYQFLVQAGRSETLTTIKSVEARGDYAVAVTLRQPSPFFLSEGLTTAYILPAHIWRDQTPTDPRLSEFQATVGTGAYRLTEVVPGESYSFQANREYFRGIPRVANLIARVVSDRAEQIDQLRKRTAAVSLTPLEPELANDLARVRRLAFAEGPGAFSYVLYTNGSRAPFDQDAVREAISLAVDTDALVQEALLGRGASLPTSFYHFALPWAVGLPHSYDPDAAKALLEFAGLRDGDGDGIREWEGHPTDYVLLCNADRPLEAQAAGLLVEQLKAVGIGVHADCVDISTQLGAMWPNYRAVPAPDYDIALFGWPSDAQLQQSFMRYLVTTPTTIGWANLTGMVDAELEQLVNQYLRAGTATEQELLSTSIQERFSEVLPMIPLMSPTSTFAYVPDKYQGWATMTGVGIGTVWSFLPTPPPAE
ncbi:MAG: peptide ABC transporter substrate-binding protein [Anaerolineae bacterium]|nr:peptide ABC transporter substrate-binding protein [Anaerolineae bacterium]